MRAVAWLVVGGTTFVAGGFGIPIGFALGLTALEVYIAACIGSVLGLVVFLYIGERVRSRTTGPHPIELDPDSGIGRVTERFGVAGLGIVGPLVPGVTMSVLIGLALGFPRNAIARWMSIGIAAMYALYTAGLWLLVEVVGLE